MIPIKVYHYKTVVRDFTIFAPLKHGTRWLSYTHYTNHTTLDKHNFKGEHITIEKGLMDTLFKNADNPYNISKIKLKKFKREISIPNPVFIYRDPYECFTKAILTGLGIGSVWDGDPNNLDIVMTSNGHFSPTLWQTIWDMCELLDDNEIQFVYLRDLSKFMRINTLEYTQYKAENFSFENLIPFGHSKDDIIEMCKEYHPTLSNNFMIQIEKETIALEKLTAKFGWNAK